MTSATTTLDSLADSLASTFPAADDAPLARALLALLARGDAVTDEQLASNAGRSIADVTTALEAWPNVQRDERGAVVAFSGLSLRPTAHRFEVGGRCLFTWCAWDTLFLPALIDARADVHSTCPITRLPVQLQVEPHGVAGAEPADLWVSFPPTATTSTARIVESFCCHVHFLAGRAAAERWLDEHPGGRVLDLRDAYHVGQRATARLRAGASP
jgi:alkylmercury lyase